MEEKKNEKINEENKRNDMPPEFDIAEFGRAIKKFYKEKTRFAVYLTLFIVGVISLITFFIVLFQHPIPHNTYRYYMGGDYFISNFNFLEFLGLGVNKPNLIGTCTPVYNDDGKLINGYEYNLCTGNSYFYITSFETLIIQFSLPLLMITTAVFGLLSYKHWKITYSKREKEIKGYIKGNKIFSKIIILVFVLVVVATILGIVLSNGKSI